MTIEFFIDEFIKQLKGLEGKGYQTQELQRELKGVKDRYIEEKTPKL